MDWEALAPPAFGPEEARAGLPIPYVLDRAQIAYAVYEDGKVHAICPFHDDTDPSLDVFDDGWSRWGCYPCGIGGDVLDLLQRLNWADGYHTALLLASQLMEDMAAAGWRAPVSSYVPAKLDLLEAGRLVASAGEDLTGLTAFIAAKGLPFTAEQLHQAWGVGSIGGHVIIPFWDGGQSLVTYKYRTADTRTFSAKGGKHTCLYGAWRDRHRAVLLTEGESDAWVASFHLRGEEISVLGLPAGAGTPPDPFAAQFAGRTVLLALDGDDAGRTGQARWWCALSQAGAKVRPIWVPDGMDLREIGAGIPALVGSGT